MTGKRFARRMLAAALLMLAAVLATGAAKKPAPPLPPNAVAADSLIRPGERHFARLWQITFGGENAAGYWSSRGDQIIFQSTRDGYPCDRQYVRRAGGRVDQRELDEPLLDQPELLEVARTSARAPSIRFPAP